MNVNTSERNVIGGSVLTPGLVDLQKFMFSDRYHLRASTLARAFYLMTEFMVWITSFNRCTTSLSLLLLNVFLKVRAMYFKVGSTISGAFEGSACLVGSPLTCTSSTVNFLGVEGPFLDEVSPSSVV